jgi:hypothetical protein
MISNSSTEPQHIFLFSRLLSLLIDAEELERERRYRTKGVDRITIPDELPMNFSKRFANYLVSISDIALNVFIEELKKGCNTAPELVRGLLLHVEYYTEIMGKKELYWRLWQQLSERVQSIALEISLKQGREYIARDDRTKLIRDMLHRDVPWQKVDYINQEIVLGKESILEFVKNVGVNSDVFESMASLMHHFPTVFQEEGLLILSKHQQDVGGSQLLSGVNTNYYLVRCLQHYLLFDTTGALPNELYKACWILLDAIVETASSEAYYLREHLIRSRRITIG